MSSGNGRAFWCDTDYDHEHASDGVSRLRAYIRQSSLVASCWDESSGDTDVERAEWFAVAAWETASPPVMAPGFVRRDPVIRHARVARQQDGPLAGIVDLAAPWPTQLSRSLDWRRGQEWRSWPVDDVGGWYFDPADDGMTGGHRLALPTVRLEFPLMSRDQRTQVVLPDAPDGPERASHLADMVLHVLAEAMDQAVQPVIDALGRPG